MFRRGCVKMMGKEENYGQRSKKNQGPINK